MSITYLPTKSPFVNRYLQFRELVPEDHLLLFRLGDFYEALFHDAERLARLTGVALTKRNGVPMSGFSFQHREEYLAKLAKAGQKVAWYETR